MPLRLNLFIADEAGTLTEVEMFKDESVTLIQTLKNIKNVEKVFSDFSKTFAVPASKNNNKLFRHYYRYDIDGFTSRQKKEAQLYLNHQLFKKGKVKLESVKLLGNKPHTYNLTFFGESINLKDFFGEDLLGSLGYLSNFSFDYNATNVIAALQNGQDFTVNTNGENEQYDDAIVVPLITHTDRLFYNSNTNVAGQKNLFVSSSVVQGVPFEQLKPALRIFTIIKAIEDKYNIENGYSQDIKFSRDFFNKDNLPFYNLYLWLHRKKGGVLEDDSIVQQCKNWGDLSGANTADRNFWEPKVKSSYWNIRQPQNTKTVEIRHAIIVTPPPLTTSFDIIIERDGEEHYRQTVTASDLNFNFMGSSFTAFDTGFMLAEAGQYTLFISCDTSSTYHVELKLKETVKKFLGSNNRTATAFGSVEITTDAEFSANSQLPKMTVIDFLSSIFKMFNLIAYQNDRNIIVVESLNDFYNNSTTNYDITEYLDTTLIDVESVLPFAKLNLKYKGTKTFLANDHNERFGLEWGSLKFSGDEKVEGQEFKIELPFEHMKFERLKDQSVLSPVDTTVQVGYHVDDNQQPYLGEPLLFYPVKVTSGTAISVLSSSSSQTSITQYYVPSNSVALTDSQTINFGSEYNEYAKTLFNTSLFKTYFESYIKGLFNIRTRLYRVKAYLPLRIILNLSLADKLVAFDTIFKINSIKTNFATGISELELINETENFTLVDSPKHLGDLISKPFITIDSTKLTTDTVEQTIDAD
tara:strand:- start:972 stop:3224 length:2253 start_codon:yes stop_codon:yes gene_type:complete